MEAISTFSNEVSYQIAVIIGSYLFLEAISCFWKENEVSLAKNVLLFTIGIIGCFLFYQALGSLLCLLLYAIIPSFSNGVSYHSAITTIRIIIIESSAVWSRRNVHRIPRQWHSLWPHLCQWRSAPLAVKNKWRIASAKKQWNLRFRGRCKECIEIKRAVQFSNTDVYEDQIRRSVDMIIVFDLTKEQWTVQWIVYIVGLFHHLLYHRRRITI